MVNFSLEKGNLTSPGAVVLQFDPTKLKAPPTSTLNLVRRDGTFHIMSVECAEFNLEVNTETIREGQEYRLSVTSHGQR
jgi:hypothetical protein